MRVAALLCVAVFLLLLQCSATGAQDVQKYIDEVINDILGLIDNLPLEKLEPQQRNEAAAIRATTARQLNKCASSVHSSADIWRFKSCSNEQQEKALTKLGRLMKYVYEKDYRGGAASVRAFWCNMWQYIRLLW